MSYVLEESTEMTALANAIRTKTGSNASMSVSDMTTAVSNISSGGGNAPTEYVSFTRGANGKISSATVVTTDTRLPITFQEPYLTSITLPSTLTTLSVNAFMGCGNLYDITLPSSLTAIPDNAFNGCINLVALNLPSGITSIGSGAFNGCTQLALINLPDAIQTIGGSAFRYCQLTPSLSLPSNLIVLDGYAFGNCTNLTTVYFNSTLNTLHRNAFYQSSSITDIYVPWSEGAISNAPWGATNATIHYNYSPSQ